MSNGSRPIGTPPAVADNAVGITDPQSKPSSASSSDWLGPSLLAARAMTAAADSAPFPYVRGVFGTVLVILESIDKVKKNRDNLKQLCGNIIEIMKVVQSHAHFYEDSDATKLENVCMDFESALQAVLLSLRKMQAEPKGFRGRLKGMMNASGAADEITGHERKIQELRQNVMLVANLDTNQQVHKLGSTLQSYIPAATPVQDNHNFNNCPPASRIFQGRQDVLKKMQHCFSEDLESQQVYVLYGLGGAGKTQIALKFIEQSKSRFSSTFLIDTSTEETIDSGLKNIAVKMKIGDTAEAAIQWLSSKREEWLLFFDNADDPEIDMNKFLPQCKHGNIIITTRNPGLCVYAGSNIHVENMEEEDAVLLLHRSAALDNTLKNKTIATAIVKELGYLPLAIIQAGAFIAKSRNLEGYLAIYSTNKTRLLSEKPRQSHDNYVWTVYTTWQMSFDKLSPLAARFLQLCSLLHYRGISEEIFMLAFKYEYKSAIPSHEDLKDSLELLSQFSVPGETWDSLLFQDVATEIMAYSLMEFDPDKTVFSMHPLVHDWCQSTLLRPEASRSCMIGILGMCISCIPGQTIQLESPRFISHLDTLLRGQTQMVPDFSHQFARIYLNAGHYAKAEKLEALTLDKHRQLLGDDHHDTLRAMARLAEIYNLLGKLEEAKVLGIATLEKQKKILGVDQPETWETMANLAMTLRDLGQLEKALEFGISALEKLRQTLGDNHLDTVRSMVGVAMTYSGLGQFEEALRIFIVVHDKLEDNFGPDHPDTLVSMGNLAWTYDSLGQYHEALKFQTIVLEKQKHILGEDHPLTLITTANLAVTYSRLGQFDEAVKHQLTVLEKQRQILGHDHPNNLIAMGNLAVVYNYLQQSEEALKYEIPVLEQRRAMSGEDHPDTLRSMANLAVTYGKLGKFEEARRLQLTVLQKRRELIGEDHLDTLRAMVYLAATYYNMGNIEEANMLAPPAQEKLSADSHPHTLRAIASLVDAYRNANKVKEAEELNTLFQKHKTPHSK